MQGKTSWARGQPSHWALPLWLQKWSLRAPCTSRRYVFGWTFVRKDLDRLSTWAAGHRHCGCRAGA